MRAAALAGVSRRRRVITTRRDPAHPPASDLVRRNFRASGPNELWVAGAGVVGLDEYLTERSGDHALLGLDGVGLGAAHPMHAGAVE